MPSWRSESQNGEQRIDNILRASLTRIYQIETFRFRVLSLKFKVRKSVRVKSFEL